ncbi:hypothetical protein BGX38DRAFT_339617 [Terfezia claveryi]|nr:hypothetical protein BGX38DRAFT_339617 [Terfezia claveryi]
MFNKPRGMFNKPRGMFSISVQNLLPVKLYNAGAREHESLVFPPGVAVAQPPLPANRRELGNMTIAECQAAAAHLGLPVLQPNTLVADRRRQIAEHLGAPLR